jgi:uncharacterized protein (TIGR02246 family)
MDRRQTIFGLLAAGPAMMGSKVGATIPDGANDKVRRLAEFYAAAWNASDMDAMAKLYASDVHWVNIVGMHWQGKAQVDQAHRAYFDIMFKGVPLTLEAIESVVALPGGALVAVIRWAVGAFKTPFGQQVPPSRDRMSLVLVPKDDRLVIAHGSNVQIDEMAQRSDPTAKRTQ